MDTKDKQGILSLGKISSPIGEMTIITDQTALLYLSFSDNPKLALETASILDQKEISQSPSSALRMIQTELTGYFLGEVKKFNTPIRLLGTPFQDTVWQSLLHIPYGHTISYTEQAKMTGNNKACRAVAKANSQNILPIIVPCHRVINLSGKLGGYAGGTKRKQWLIDHEKQHC